MNQPQQPYVMIGIGPHGAVCAQGTTVAQTIADFRDQAARHNLPAGVYPVSRRVFTQVDGQPALVDETVARVAISTAYPH